WTPKAGRQGYQPEQPIPFDHALHAGQLGMDCRYCHSYVENSPHSNVPSAQTCWNCHQVVARESEKLIPLREAMDESYEGYTGAPIKWVEIHHVPDYAYFNHQVHVNRGISCKDCHGKINEMEVVWHHESQSMGWCLDCHRNPEKSLRPLDQITNMDWKPEDTSRDEFYAMLAGHKSDAEWKKFQEQFNNLGPLTQEEIGLALKEAWGVNPPQSCNACHR
ncbi:MAG: cytochrome c3 family protein, partial [Verrucomicrobiota bacterium]